VEPPRPDELWNAEPPTSPDRDLLRRHRALQAISVVLIAAGIVLPIVALATTKDLLSDVEDPAAVQRLLGPLLLLVVGGLLPDRP